VNNGSILTGCSRWFAETPDEAIMKEKELESLRKRNIR